MGFEITDNGTPDPDNGADLDRDNPDTYEEGDDNGNTNVQV